MAERKLSFAVFGNASKAFDSHQITEILGYLWAHEADVYIEQNFYNSLQKELKKLISIAGVFEGVNFDVDFEGRYEIEERAVIQLEADGKALENCPFALNDIAILKRDNAAMISIRASVNDEYLVTYLADGLVISTPTGSTAYSLSVGGPIIVPQSGILSMTPVAPHSLNIRPIVISDEAEIKLEVQSRSHNFLAAVDGRSEKLSEGVTLKIRKAPHKVRIVKVYGQRFFTTLREKLMWGADTRQL